MNAIANYQDTSSRAAIRPRPILMVPLRRCGSHALRLRLNFNEKFYSPYPLHIVDFMPLVPLYGDLSDDKNYFRLVVDVVGLQSSGVVKWTDIVFDPIAIFDAIGTEQRSVHRIVWELLLRAGEKRGAHVVMDKSLDSVHYAKELLTLFPNMLFLNVVRDPRAQVASMNRAIIHDFDSAMNAHTWVSAHRAAQALIGAFPERVLTVRFEDFLLDQEAILRKVCSFMGVEFLPQMLNVKASVEARQISQMSALWASNCFAPIAANRDKFKAQLSLQDIENIETITHDYMAHYGYEFMTPAQAPLNEEGALVAQSKSDAGRQNAWKELERDNYRDFTLRRFRADYLSQIRASLQSSQMKSDPSYQSTC